MTKTIKEKCKHDFRAVGNAGEGYYELCLRCNKTKPITETTEEIIKETPMGVSQWKNHGKKYGYETYLLTEQRKYYEKQLSELIEQRKSDLDETIKWCRNNKEVRTIYFNEEYKEGYRNSKSDTINYLVALKGCDCPVNDSIKSDLVYKNHKESCQFYHGAGKDKSK